MHFWLLACFCLFSAGCAEDLVPLPMPVERECGLNEQYTECGSACPTQCSDLHSDSGPQNCITVCVQGCECMKGYVRNKDNICISEEECLAMDKPPVPTRCPSGLPELKGYNCGRVVDRQSCPSTHYCEVHPADAYAVCCPNKDPCETAVCEPDETCVHTPINCVTTPCPQYICEKQECPLVKCSTQCKYGYKKDRKTGCVGCTCRGKCRKNEELNDCGACDKTCEQFQIGESQFCTQDCRAPECGCKPGFARNHKGRCIPESRCACKPNPCEKGQKCFADPKTCITTPCLQYRCEDRGNVCVKPMRVGKCEAAITRWYHNRKSGQCEEFSYGGCGGNRNRFETQAECEERCPPRKG